MLSHTIGKRAENMALSYLEKHGLTMVASNYRSRRGEIDLIMEDDTLLVFVEIRYRQSAKYGSALESVNAQKQSHIIYTAQSYIQKNPSHHSSYRFDVVAIEPNNDTISINWIKDAFQLS